MEGAVIAQAGNQRAAAQSGPALVVPIRAVDAVRLAEAAVLLLPLKVDIGYVAEEAVDADVAEVLTKQDIHAPHSVYRKRIRGTTDSHTGVEAPRAKGNRKKTIIRWATVAWIP